MATGSSSGFGRDLFRLDQRDRAIAPAALRLEREPGIRELALRQAKLGFHLLDLRKPALDCTRRDRLSAHAQQLLLELRLLLLGFAEAVFQGFGALVLGPLKLLHLGARFHQFIAHRTQLAPLRVDLSQRHARGFGFGIGPRPGLFKIRAHAIDLLFLGGQLADRRFRFATIRDHFAQQCIAVADEVTERLQALEDGQLSG